MIESDVLGDAGSAAGAGMPTARRGETRRTMLEMAKRAFHILRPPASHGLLAAAVLLLCVSAGSDAFGCPNCKDAVNTTDPEGLNVARGYFYSILLMLAMPFTLVGSFGIYVWREMRRQRQSSDAVPPDFVAEPRLGGGQGVASPPTAAVP
jgi:hypothetical protein